MTLPGGLRRCGCVRTRTLLNPAPPSGPHGDHQTLPLAPSYLQCKLDPQPERLGLRAPWQACRSRLAVLSLTDNGARAWPPPLEQSRWGVQIPFRNEYTGGRAPQAAARKRGGIVNCSYHGGFAKASLSESPAPAEPRGWICSSWPRHFRPTEVRLRSARPCRLATLQGAMPDAVWHSTERVLSICYWIWRSMASCWMYASNQSAGASA